MEQFATEEQQVEAIKKFWKDHGTAIIIGAVVGFGGLIGWREYDESQIAAKEAASEAYQTAVETLVDENGEANVSAFISSTTDSGYADIAGLVLAQQAVNEGDFEKAATELARVFNSPIAPEVSAVAGLRLARVQMELDQADQALVTLNAIQQASFKPQVEELKGDAYVKQGKPEQARVAYTAALESNENNRLLQMKLDNLSLQTDA